MIYKYKQKMKSQYLRSGTEESAFRAQREVWAEPGGRGAACARVSTRELHGGEEPWARAETTIQGALIFGRTEVTIMV